jgi:hypothetical protein
MGRNCFVIPSDDGSCLVFKAELEDEWIGKCFVIVKNGFMIIYGKYETTKTVDCVVLRSRILSDGEVCWCCSTGLISKGDRNTNRYLISRMR